MGEAKQKAAMREQKRITLKSIPMRALRLLVNWVCIVTSPIWVLPALIGTIAWDFWKNRKATYVTHTKKVFGRGEMFLWD